MSEDRLRVAMLSVHSCPLGRLGSKDTGGMSVYIRELARELGLRGHTVDIYTRAHDLAEGQVQSIGENARVIHLQVGEVAPLDKLVLYAHLDDVGCAVENFRRSHNLTYDLIHSHYWLSGYVGARVQAWWNVPHITMFHTLGAAKNATGIGEEEAELRVVTEEEIAGGCQRIIAATDAERESLLGCCGVSTNRVSVIPCGVDLRLFQCMDRKAARQRLGFNGGNMVLFVGRIDPLKGVDNLLKALSVMRTGNGLKLVIVGGDAEGQAEMDRLRGLSRFLNIEGAVLFTGAVEHQDLPVYYSAADVCVVPSYYESFGLVALESLACGTPVVATRVGGAEDVIIEYRNGQLVESSSPSDLADAIGRVLSSSAAQSPGSIRASVSGLSWSNVAECLLTQYRAVISEYRLQRAGPQASRTTGSPRRP
jgi:D-inositol-3-phosphate glycosyltransferase